MFHTDGHGHDPVNPDFLWYANAGMPGGRTDRQPLPPDTIHYEQNELKDQENQWLIKADAHPTAAAYDIHEGLGTMRYTAIIEAADSSFRLSAPTMKNFSPGHDGDAVARVVIRRDDSYLGYLTGYFNVPGVFGPYDNEIKGHLGVDCSHMVVNAWREFSGQAVPFTNVTGLRTSHVKKGYLEEVSGDVYLDSDGSLYKTYDRETRSLSVPMKIEAREGDLVLFEYSANPKRRQWDHIGVVYQHRKPGDSLGPQDLLIHSGPSEAMISPLASSAFVQPSDPTRIAVLRWKTAGGN